MRIPIKVPSLPFAAAVAHVGHWYRIHGEVVARNETIVELRVGSEIIPIIASQAGLLEVLSIPETIEVGDILCYLKTGLPNLIWDEQQETLLLETYRPQEVTTSMEFDLRRKLRELGEAKLGKGFGTGLASPQVQNPRQEQGAKVQGKMEQARRFEVNPLLANSSQFSGNFKAAPAAVPSEAELAPHLALGASPQLGPSPSAPTPRRN